MTYLTSVAGGVADAGSTTHDSPSLTVSGTNKVMWVLTACSDGSPATPTGVVWDPTGSNQAASLQGAGLTFGTFGNASLWRLIAPNDATAVARITWAASKGERAIVVWVETDLDQGTPNGTVASNSAGSTGSGATLSAGAVSTTVGQRVLMFGHQMLTTAFIGSAEFSSPTGTERHDVVTSGTAYDAVAAQEQTAAGTSVTPTWLTAESPDGYAVFAFALNVGGAAVPSLDIIRNNLRPRAFAPGIAR